MSSQKPLQGGVSQYQIEPAKTLSEVIDDNGGGDWWAGLKPEHQNDVAEAYKAKYLNPIFDEQQVPDEVKNDVLTEFNKKYQVGDVQFTDQQGQNKSFDDLGILGQLNTYLTAGTNYIDSVVDPAVNTFTFGLVDPRKDSNQAQSQYMKGIETDPGFLGDSYRFKNNNEIANTLGSIAGAFGGTGNIIKGAGEGIAKNLGKLPLLGKLSEEALTGMGATGLFQGATGLSNVIQGKQNPLTALADTAAAFGTGGLAGKGRILNAGVQALAGGASAGASSVVDDLANSRAIDVSRALKEAGKNAAIGAGMGLAIGGGKPKEAAKSQEPKQAVPVQKNTFDPDLLPSQSRRHYDFIKSKDAVSFKNELLGSDPDAKLMAEIKLKELSKFASTAKDPARFQDNPTAQNTNTLRIAVKKFVSQVNAEIKNNNKLATNNTIEQAINAGVKAKQKGRDSVVSKKFNDIVKKYTKEDQFKINKGIEDRLNKAKEQKQAEANKAKSRQQRKADVAKKEREAQAQEKAKAREDAKRLEAEAKARQERLKQIEAENKKADAEQRKALEAEAKKIQEDTKKAEADKKQAEKQAKAPKILDNAEIVGKVDELISHKENNEAGSLEAKVSQYRKAAKEDYTKYGFSKERSEATQDSYRKLLDLYNQKAKAKAEKPSRVQYKEAQLANRKDLSKLNEQGGRYNPGDKTALQKPASGMTLEEAKNVQEWETLSPQDKEKASILMDAAETDSAVIIEYTAEKSGNTSTYGLKEVYPRSLDFTKEGLVLRAVNANGHDTTYYISESGASKKTGLPSYMASVEILPETMGQGKSIGLEANAYHGQREVPVSDILNRPMREAPLTNSEIESGFKAFYGQSVKKLKTQLNKDLKKANSKSPELAQETNKAIKDGGFDEKGVKKVVETLGKADEQKAQAKQQNGQKQPAQKPAVKTKESPTNPKRQKEVKDGLDAIYPEAPLKDNTTIKEDIEKGTNC